MEKVINQIVMLLAGEVDVKTLRNFKTKLTILMGNYDIRTKEEHLTVREDYIPEEYKIYIVAKKMEGKSDNTIEAYNTTMPKFFYEMDKPIKDITTNDVRVYLYKYQSRTGCSNKSMDQKRIIINGFFNWCVDNEYIEKNPCRQIAAIKSQQAERQPLSEEEFEKLRGACKNKRDKALVEFLAATACRVSEAISANVSDIDFAKDELRVVGKGNKVRTIYLTPRAKIALVDYIHNRKGSSDALFCSTIAPYERLTKPGIERIVREVGKAAGINKRIYPHLIRHTTATLALERGMNITDIQTMLGHSKIDTTLIYAKTSNASVKNSHHKYVT